MPIYSYECKCGNEFSAHYASFKTAEKYINAKKCDKCGKRAERVMGSFGVSFKGHFPGERIKEVAARKKRQEQRLSVMKQKGEISKTQIDQMGKIAQKSKYSPWTHDPAKLQEEQREAKKRAAEVRAADHEIDYKSSKPPGEPDFDGYDAKKVRSRRKKKKS